MDVRKLLNKQKAEIAIGKRKCINVLEIYHQVSIELEGQYKHLRILEGEADKSQSVLIEISNLKEDIKKNLVSLFRLGRLLF